MNRFNISVRTGDASYEYGALQRSAIEALLDALDLFGLCAVTVRPA
jgi:exopolyphosphatase/pppGpp-phosphohydrolase